MEAIHEAKEYHFKEAREKIELADEEFTKAHHEQTKLLQEESKGSKHEVTVILVHAQDHLMTAMTVKDLANEMIDMYEKIQKAEEIGRASCREREKVEGSSEAVRKMR